MILPGHIALAIFGHKLLRVELPTAIAATLAPDLVDKALAQVLQITPSGRYAMHSLVGWLAASAVAYLLGGKQKGRAWAVGHFLHFVGDGGEMPWLLFLRQYSFSGTRGINEVFWEAFGTTEGLLSFAFEMVLLGGALTWLAHDRHAKRAGGVDKGAA
jgi:hypothetical protein